MTDEKTTAADAAPALPKPDPKAVHKLAASTQRLLSRLDKLLSTPSGIDRTLSLLYYTSLLIAPQLSRLAARTTVPLPGTRLLLLTPTSTFLASSSSRLRTLAARISDVRIFMRLWGLIGIYHWGAGVWNDAAADPVARALELAQVAVNVGFQVTENAAYLAMVKVVELRADVQTRLWLWSSRCWLAHILLDFVRIARLRQVKRGGTKAERKAWRKATVCNMANAPLALHWSLADGLLHSETVGALGSIPAVWNFRDMWRALE